MPHRRPPRDHGPDPKKRHGKGPDHHDHDHDHDATDLELGSRMYVEFRAQNIELLKLAAQVAGFGPGAHATKFDDPKPVLDQIWDLYAEFQEWIDPEGDDDESDE